MELLLNITWLVVSGTLGLLLVASRRRCEAVSGKCTYSRGTAWISYAILIALLLPAISMTDDLMAMVAPTDGEQIARRYEATSGGPHHAKLQVAMLPVVRDGFRNPLAVIGNLEVLSAFRAFSFLPPQHIQGRAPPTVA